MDKVKSSATETRIKRVMRVERKEDKERGSRRDHLYDALASMDMETRLATINRMAERMGVRTRG